MVKMTAKEIAQAVKGNLFGNADAVVSDIQYDSRAVGAGSLFVPIVGENVDAHRFIPQCLEKGAAVCG